jgi:hypothetical protein
MLRGRIAGNTFGFVIGVCGNAWRFAETYLIINRQMVRYLTMMTMVMKLKASHYFCVKGVSCGTGHRRKSRHELRYTANNGSAPTGRIFVTLLNGGFYWGQSRKFNIDCNLTKITGTLHVRSKHSCDYVGYQRYHGCLYCLGNQYPCGCRAW